MLKEAMQSPFILKKIKKTSWENRTQIKNLFLLYRLMQKQRLSAAEGQLYFILREKYQEDYMALLKESNPLKYEVYLEEQQHLLNLEQYQQKHKEEQYKAIVEQERKEYELWTALQKRA